MVTLLLALALAADDPAQEPTTPTPPVEEHDEVARADSAEARRLRGELQQAAKNSRHDAVDRLYLQLLGFTDPIPQDVHVAAADAARARGDVMHAAARLQRAGDTEKLDDLGSRFGTVRFSVATPGAELKGPDTFAPDEAAAIEWVKGLLATEGRRVAMLPAGRYEVAGRALVVPAGGSTSVLVD